ncbi:J domain-containing protein [Archangium sp. miwbw1]|uniref:J domain-containing protein n=1 Tax=Archangium lansingense TaxID=2995310 RepID=A0ABT4AGM7_9BACT|nr:J domain-containing protein [Archangium lansinium]MCY1080800.1 J domain-containing protein [Archangium lansinium]
MALFAESAELQDGELILTGSSSEPLVSARPPGVSYLSSASVAPISDVAPSSEVWFDAPPAEDTAALPEHEDTNALRLAREQADAALMQDMQEAMRRAGAPPPESWLIEESVASPAPVAPTPTSTATQVSALDMGDELDWGDLVVSEQSAPAAPVPVAPAPAAAVPVAPAPVAPAPAAPAPVAPAPTAPPLAARPSPAAPPRAAVPPGLRSPAAGAPAPVPPGLRSPAVGAPPPAPRAPAPAPRAPAPAAPVPPNLSARTGAPAAPAPAPAPMQPLRLGPDATRPAGDDDLWRIVTFDNAPSGEAPGDINASFEAALQQVDAHLESLVRTDVPPAAAVPVPPTGKATVAPTPVVAPPSPDPAPSPAPVPSPAPAAPVQARASIAPDAWDDLSLGEDDLAEEPSDEAAKARRQALLQRAAQLGSRPAPEAPAASAPSPGAPAPVSSEEQQLAQLAQAIEKRYEDVQQKRDHFTTLGLPIDPEVTREQVKTAFLGLAKRFHPDRLPPALSALAPKMTTVFEAIRDAYEVLYNDTQRVAYLQDLRTKSASQATTRPSGVDPNDLFKMGEVFFRKRDFAVAAEHFERAYNAEPRAVYLAARAWAIYMDPQRKAELPKTKQMMAEALKLDPNCDRAHYQLGVIARVEGDMARAERHFREAVRANPKHLEANQELRLIEMRKKNPPPTKKGGLFS